MCVARQNGSLHRSLLKICCKKVNLSLDGRTLGCAPKFVAKNPRTRRPFGSDIRHPLCWFLPPRSRRQQLPGRRDVIAKIRRDLQPMKAQESLGDGNVSPFVNESNAIRLGGAAECSLRARLCLSPMQAETFKLYALPLLHKALKDTSFGCARFTKLANTVCSIQVVEVFACYFPSNPTRSWIWTTKSKKQEARFSTVGMAHVQLSLAAGLLALAETCSLTKHECSDRSKSGKSIVSASLVGYMIRLTDSTLG